MTPDITRKPANGPDPKGVAAARDLRKRLNAECVVLLGSRARGDYRENKLDVDFIAIVNEQVNRAAEIRVRKATAEAVRTHYGFPMPFDSIAMTPGEYQLKSRHSVNHPAAKAAREGIFVPRNEGEYGRETEGNPHYREDYTEEYRLTQDRIADANGFYGSMQALIDANADDLPVLGAAQKALDHGLKAYISARSSSYGETHNPEELADRMQELLRRDPDYGPMEFQSDLQRLTAFSGGQSYGPLTGDEDYHELSNCVTADLAQIYRFIERLTGQNPWETPTRLRGLQVEPRVR